MNTRVNSSGSAQKKLLAAILMAASVPGNGSLGTAGEVVLKSWCGRGDGSLKRIIFVSGKGQKASRPVPSLHYTMQWENAIILHNQTTTSAVLFMQPHLYYAERQLQ